MSRRDDEDRGREPRSGGAADGRSAGRGGPGASRGGAGASRGSAGAGRGGAGASRGGASRGGSGGGERSGGYGRDAGAGRGERSGGYGRDAGAGRAGTGRGGSGGGERSGGYASRGGERSGGYGRDGGADENRGGGRDRRGSGDAGERTGGYSGERTDRYGRDVGAGRSGGARSGGRPTGGGSGRPTGAGAGRPGSGAGRPTGAGAGRPGTGGTGGSGGSGRPGSERGLRGGAGAGRSGSGTSRSGASAGRSVRPGAGWNTRGANEASPDAGRGRGGQSKGGPTRDVHEPGGIRLQKVLASAGLGSRRACEVLIEEGRVSVDGVVVRELGVRVEPSTAVIHVDGLRVQLDSSVLTIALHKPAGVVSTMSDPQGRPTLEQYVADRTERLFHVGRLDEQTEGLLLLTNDGELAHRLAHPSYEVVKTYVATIEGRAAPGLSKLLRTGVELEDGPASVDKFTVLETATNMSVVEVELHEGRTHIVRRLFEEVGHPVVRLVRVRFGPIRLGALKPGKTRVIGGPELGSLMSAVDL